MCDHISLENKKNIESNTETKDILQNMEDLTKQLETFKYELLTISSERYSVFKDSFQNATAIHNVIS